MMYRFDAGGLRCVVLNVGQFEMSAGVLFADADETSLRASLERHRLPVEPIVFQINPLVVDTGVHRVMIDPGGAGPTDRLPTALRDAGMDPGTIDTVVITHGHADHYWGCVGADGAPAFPGARHVMQRAEWDHWVADDNPEPNHAETFRQVLVPMRDRFDLLDGDGEIVPGIEAIGTPGHSPGHMVVRIGGRAVHTGDAVLNVVYVEHPEWTGAFDVWPDQVVATRRRLLRLLAEEHLLAVQCHFPLPGVGRVVADDGGWRWAPEDLAASAVPVG